MTLSIFTIIFLQQPISNAHRGCLFKIAIIYLTTVILFQDYFDDISQ